MLSKKIIIMAMYYLIILVAVTLPTIIYFSHYFRDSFCNSPLHYSVQSGHLACAKLLLEKEAEIHVTNKSKVCPSLLLTL